MLCNFSQDPLFPGTLPPGKGPPEASKEALRGQTGPVAPGLNSRPLPALFVGQDSREIFPRAPGNLQSSTPAAATHPRSCEAPGIEAVRFSPPRIMADSPNTLAQPVNPPRRDPEPQTGLKQPRISHTAFAVPRDRKNTGEFGGFRTFLFGWWLFGRSSSACPCPSISPISWVGELGLKSSLRRCSRVISKTFHRIRMGSRL